MNIDYFAMGILTIGAAVGSLRFLQIFRLCYAVSSRKADLVAEGKRRLFLYSVAIVTLIICYVGCRVYARKAPSILVLGVIFFVVLIDRLSMKLKKELKK